MTDDLVNPLDRMLDDLERASSGAPQGGEPHDGDLADDGSVVSEALTALTGDQPNGS